MKATILINTRDKVKKITKEFLSPWDAKNWIVNIKSDHYYGYTDDGTFAIVWGFDFSQLDSVNRIVLSKKEENEDG